MACSLSCFSWSACTAESRLPCRVAAEHEPHTWPDQWYSPHLHAIGFEAHSGRERESTGSFKGNTVSIPRMALLPKDGIGRAGLTFKQRQFPLRPAFAATINDAQGQTLVRAGLYLPDRVFTPGQQYVAFSRAGGDG